MQEHELVVVRQRINIAGISRVTKIDRTTIAKYLSEAGVEPVDAYAKKGAKDYYIEEVLGALVKSFKARAQDGAKARKEAADAEKAEIVVAKLRGDLVPVGEVRNSAADLVKSLYQRLVMLSPRLLSDKITGNTDRTEVEIIIRTHNAGIFDELRSLPSSFLVNTLDSSELEDAQPV